MEKELRWLLKDVTIKLNQYHDRWEEAAVSASMADCVWAMCKRK